MKSSRILPLGLVVSLIGALPAIDVHARTATPLLQPETVKLPDTAPGRCAAAFVAMVNNPDADTVKAFEDKFGSTKRRAAVATDERAKRIKALHEEWGMARITKVAESSDSGITLMASAARAGNLELEFKFDAAEAGKLEAVMIQNIVDSAPLTSEIRTSTVEAAARTLEEMYVYPEVAKKMAESVLAKLKSGDYDSVADEAALARRLTQDLQAVSKDKHLRVAVSPSNAEPQPHGTPIAMLPPREEMRQHNYAFKKTEVLDGNIGYLRFDAFVEDEEANQAATAALGFLAHCDALIFDLRYNGGGSPEMIRFLTSYLFDQPTHLNDMIDRDGKVVEEYWTLKDVPGKRFATNLPVYVLTSSRTFSGAEEFSYNLKSLKRATLVGETTGGGAHPVRGERLNDRFLIRVPFMRANNPISKTNWEGTGVEPDIKVPADAALDRALETIRAAATQTRK